MSGKQEIGLFATALLRLLLREYDIDELLVAMQAIIDAKALSEDTPIESLKLPSRVFNALTLSGIKTVGQARRMDDRELRAINNFGRVSLAELRAVIGYSNDTNSVAQRAREL